MTMIATAVKHFLAASVPHDRIVEAITEMEAVKDRVRVVVDAPDFSRSRIQFTPLDGRPSRYRLGKVEDGQGGFRQAVADEEPNPWDVAMAKEDESSEKPQMSDAERWGDPDANLSRPQRISIAGPDGLDECLGRMWNAAPAIARKRSSMGEARDALRAAWRRGHPLAKVEQGVKHAYASDIYRGDYAKGLHALIRRDRWLPFVDKPLGPGEGRVR